MNQSVIGTILGVAAIGLISNASGSSSRKKKKRRKTVRRKPVKAKTRKVQSQNNQKDELIKRAREIFDENFRDLCKDEAGVGLCPYWAWSVIQAGKEFGRNFVLQAGSAQWQHIPDHLDDGVSPNAFGYVWSPNDMRSRLAMARGNLPEMHVWVGDPSTHELIDITAGQFPDQAKRIMGYEWKSERPPDYLWVTGQEMPEGAHYEANRDATIFIHRLLQSKGLL